MIKTNKGKTPALEGAQRYTIAITNEAVTAPATVTTYDRGLKRDDKEIEPGETVRLESFPGRTFGITHAQPEQESPAKKK